jgi:hypothetical protein
MEPAAKKTILRIELWHGILLAGMLVTLGRGQWVDPTALLVGGLFMGANFLLLSFAIAWLLTPLANKRRVRAGVALLVLKIVIFLGLLATAFFRFELDAISFALGFSTLIVAILIESIRKSLTVENQNGTSI